jgi:hypothetical protein
VSTIEELLERYLRYLKDTSKVSPPHKISVFVSIYVFLLPLLGKGLVKCILVPAIRLFERISKERQLRKKSVDILVVLKAILASAHTTRLNSELLVAAGQ